jgi:hypothetical protein
MVGAAGFEPTTSCSRNRRATRLRYAPLVVPGVSARVCVHPGFAPTQGPTLRGPHAVGPGGGRALLDKTLEPHLWKGFNREGLRCPGWHLNMVGVIGFEPTTYGTQNRRATRLRYTPMGSVTVHTCLTRRGGVDGGASLGILTCLTFSRPDAPQRRRPGGEATPVAWGDPTPFAFASGFWSKRVVPIIVHQVVGYGRFDQGMAKLSKSRATFRCLPVQGISWGGVHRTGCGRRGLWPRVPSMRKAKGGHPNRRLRCSGIRVLDEESGIREQQPLGNSCSGANSGAG